MTRELWHYWMRFGGSDTTVFRLAPLAHCPLWTQLLCALVRRDVDGATAILSGDPALWMLAFLGAMQDNALASLCSGLIYELGLRDLVCSIAVDQDTDGLGQTDREQALEGVWHKHSLFVNLQRRSGIEASRYDEFDDRFLELLDCLAPMAESLIWPKGISLSRSLYVEPFYRTSGDFDCILPQDSAAAFTQLCGALGYHPLSGDPGFCNQLEVGPTSSFGDLFASPSPSMTPSAVIGLSRKGWPIIDPKFNPLDRGLKCKEAERFYNDALALHWRNRTFKAPSHIDHLMIALVHSEKDRFRGWKSLIDIQLLAQQVTEAHGWQEFLRRCQVEGIRLSAWAGLFLVSDRFGPVVPADVLQELMPSPQQLSVNLSFTLEPLFYWNCSSLPALLLNAWFTGDRSNKLRTLRETVLPSKQFLSQYYASGRHLTIVEEIAVLIVHWLILFVPGLLVRRTFGRLLWRSSLQYQEIQGALEQAPQ